jgi:hypothetical protein
MSVKTIGGLNLYDPNENIGGDQYSSYGFGTNPDSNNAVNQEDLIMYCNLRAFTSPRSYIMNSNSDGVKTQAVASARINFLKPNPEKNKFTTDWTDLDASGKPNGDEMLGINSVQITYDTSYVPRVTITMTDVRGQALNEDPKDSPYGAFFNFPYPMFVLEVKGYYGKAVKYLLHLLKYSSRFDYATGNFQITCEFVGFTYALLSDLNVQYGLVASQMLLNGKTGKERLIKKYESQIQRYKNIYPDIQSDIESIIKSEVYTLVGLINKAKDLNTIIESLGEKSEFFNKKSLLDIFIDYIRTLYDNINSSESVTNIDFNTRILEINNNTLIKNYPNEFSNLKYTGGKPDNTTDKLSDKYKKEYTDYWQKSQVIITKSNNEIMKTIDDNVKNEITNILGFSPTIRNIMLIICNNFELFLDLLTETTQNAASKVSRKYTLQNIMREGDPKRSNQKLENVYPWPALFNTNYDICYFDDLPTLNINDYPEKDFVESYLNALAQTNELLKYSGGTNNTNIINQVFFNPIHTQEYSDLKKPIFGSSTNEIILNIVEHALLVTSNTFLNNGKNQEIIKKLGENDGYNFINEIGDNIIKYKWLEDPKNILTDDVINKLNDNKTNFKYITSDITSDYLTDIVRTSSINTLSSNYPSLNNFNFVFEVKSNLLPNGEYDFSIYNSEGFLEPLYVKDKLPVPDDIYLNWIFEPFMDEREVSGLASTIKRKYYNKEYLKDQYKLLLSLRNFLMYSSFGVSGGDVLTRINPDQLKKYVPGITDDYDFILFNGVYTTNMLCSLSYILFDKTFGDTKLRKLFDKRFYFPFTSPTYPTQDAKFNSSIIYNNGKIYEFVLGPYKELIEKIVGVFSTDSEVEDLDELDLYRINNASEAKFSINKSTPPGQVITLRNNKKIYQEVYSLIADFFNSEIKMVSKSNGLKTIYEDPKKALGSVISDKISYNNKQYGYEFNSNIINYYLEGFTNAIKIKSDEKIKPNSNTEGVKTALDLKRSLYQTFKNINDKWIIDKPNGGTNIYSWGLTGDVDPNTNEPLYDNKRQFLFDHFFFVDRINRDIGSKLFLDFRVLDDYYEKVNSKNSLYSIIGELAKMNEMIFHPLTSYINFNGVTSDSNKKASIDGLFKPTTTLDFQNTAPVFIMQYVGKNASYQYENQNHLPDVVKIDFSNDKFLSPPDSPFILKDKNEISVNEPVAFFVDMGIKNQNMFRGISLDQAEFRETNESITVWDQLTSQKQNRSVQTIGNNIYPILSRRSYTCKVESLGNMMIQPTMYFYLRYVPLFSGLYLITKVSHSIQPNNVVTNFEGVRMSSLNYPLPTQFISTLSKEILEKGLNQNFKNENLKGKQRGSVSSTLDETNQFLEEVLKGIGISAPNTYQIQFMRIWRQHEGGRAAWNPFNTTLNLKDSTEYNYVPVRNYPNKTLGLQATIQTLKNGRYNNIITAIQNIKTESDINKAIVAVNDSPWGSKIKPADYKFWKTFNNFIWKNPLVERSSPDPS